jgi:hypothetical protein
MKDKKVIIVASLAAVIICLMMTALLFFAVTPKFLIILSFITGIITGVCITSLIYHIINTVKTKRSKNEKTLS